MLLWHKETVNLFASEALRNANKVQKRLGQLLTRLLIVVFVKLSIQLVASIFIPTTNKKYMKVFFNKMKEKKKGNYIILKKREKNIMTSKSLN